MNKLQKKALMAVDLLEQAYPDAICSLEHDMEKPHELLTVSYTHLDVYKRQHGGGAALW